MKPDSPLNTSNLVIGYKGKLTTTVAGPFNFDIAQGQLIGLIGINGIGKSTLIKTLSGLLPPLSGKVFVKGQDIFKLSNKKRAAQISLVLTDKINSGFATVYEIVKMGRYPHTNWQFGIAASDNEIIQSALEAVGMHDKQDSLFGELSDGNKQKAMIAKALAQDTEVMILDEPTVHLDIKNRFIILELLHNLTQKHQKTILFSGHDLDYMIQFCDQLMLITPENLTIDQPAKLVKSGAISEAFDLDTKKYNFPFLEP